MPSAQPPATRPPPPAPPYAATGAKLGWAVLAYVAGVVLVVTLEPFTFRAPARVTLTLWAPDSPWHGWFDALANVALFLPLGFFGALARSARAPGGAPARPRAEPARALALGALLSAGVEAAQLFEPGRFASPTDVLTNATGAALGAWLCARSARYLGADTPLVGRLALELPVTGLVYVALPLLTLAALTAAGGAARPLGLAALGAFGGTLLGTVQRRQLGPHGVTRPAALAAAAGLWFGVGALPAVATATPAYAAGLAAAVAGAWLVGRPGVAGVRAIERRFEGEALGRAAPWLVAYLALLPLGDAPMAWSRAAVLRDLEGGAAFAVLGYLLAEAWGRREWRYRHSAWRVWLTAASAAAVLAVLRVAAGGGAATAGATAAGVAAHALSACYGGWIYHLQRAHVRALVEARRAPAVAAGRRPERQRAGRVA